MKKYLELMKYAFWGCVSTGINLGILFGLITFTDIHYIVANTVAYIIAVIVSYFCNRKFVFHSRKKMTEEFAGFFLVRLVSLAFDNGCYYVLVDFMGLNVYVSRIFLSLFIIGGTYIINKLLIFKGGDRGEKDKRHNEADAD